MGTFSFTVLRRGDEVMRRYGTPHRVIVSSLNCQSGLKHALDIISLPSRLIALMLMPDTSYAVHISITWQSAGHLGKFPRWPWVAGAEFPHLAVRSSILAICEDDSS